MSPEDARHGSYAGAVAHWLEARTKPCPDCARAEWRYRKQRKMDALRGNPRTVAAVGIVRRIQALHAIGWTGPQIAARAGLSVHTMRSIGYHDSAVIRSVTARKLVAVYDELCGTWPEGQYANRARAMAARRGWSPPILWLDLDDPAETPDPGYTATKPHTDLDPVVVDRILAGDMSLARTATKAERVVIVARWRADGQSISELERATGWNINRYRSEVA